MIVSSLMRIHMMKGRPPASAAPFPDDTSAGFPSFGNRTAGIQLVERQDDVVLLIIAASFDLGVLFGVLPGIGVELDVRQEGSALVHVRYEILFHLLAF